MLGKNMPAMQWLGITMLPTKKKRGEATRECQQGAKGLKQVRRGAGEEERKCGKQGEMRKSDEWRQESTGYTVSSKSLRGGGGRGADERKG